MKISFKGEKSAYKYIFFLLKKSKFHFLKKMWDKLSATNQSIKNLVLGFLAQFLHFSMSFYTLKKKIYDTIT